MSISKFLLCGRVAANKTLPYFECGSVAASGREASNKTSPTLIMAAWATPNRGGGAKIWGGLQPHCHDATLKVRQNFMCGHAATLPHGDAATK